MPKHYPHVATVLCLLLTITFGNVPATALAARHSDGPEVDRVTSDSVKAGLYDNGKMWTFEYPPVDYFRSEYGFEATEEWFRKARLGTLRLPNCSASFVSPNGLVMTNHHCVRSAVAAVSRGGETLLDDGLYTRSLGEERPSEGLYVDRLVEIEDVTEEIYEAQEGMETLAERVSARDEAIQRIQERKLREVGGAEAGFQVQVVSLYSGGRYSAYTFRRYDDVRLVMAPEISIGHFGGDADNFTYPRYALDVSFLRIYENGKPLSVDDYFSWSENGAEDGEPVFVVGNPGTTLRLETVAQLEFRRDYRDRQVLEFYRNRHEALREAYEETRDDNIRATMLQASNGEKAYTGRIAGLDDPKLIARRRAAEQQFLAEIDAEPELLEQYGTLVDELGSLQREKRELGRFYAVYLSMNPASDFASETLKRALAAYEYLRLREREVGADALDQAAEAVRAVQDTPDPLDRNLLEGRIELMVENLPDLESLQEFIDGKSPGEVVADIFAHSVLSSGQSAEAALSAGTLGFDDPAVRFVNAFAEHRADFVSGWAGLTAREDELLRKRGRAQFDVYGLSIPPDATFSLRIADGVVKGYEYNGTVAPPRTTLYGLYDHYYSYLGSELEEEWKLPERWLEISGELELSTPVDIVSTNDIIGGNSGSPLLNRDLEIVGVVFDGNIESLPGAYIYRDDRARGISADSRGILEALEVAYDLDHLVHELKTGELVKAARASN